MSQVPLRAGKNRWSPIHALYLKLHNLISLIYEKAYLLMQPVSNLAANVGKERVWLAIFHRLCNILQKILNVKQLLLAILVFHVLQLHIYAQTKLELI